MAKKPPDYLGVASVGKLMKEGRGVIKDAPGPWKGPLAALLLLLAALVLLAYSPRFTPEMLPMIIWPVVVCAGVGGIAILIFPYFDRMLGPADNGDSLWKPERIKFIRKLLKVENGEIGPKQVGYINCALHGYASDEVVYLLKRMLA